MNLVFLPPALGGGVIGRSVKKKNRVLSFKATLVDSDENPVTNLMRAPVVQVIFNPEEITTTDVTREARAQGKRSRGNQFVFSGDKWHFNLSTKNYTAPGNYVVTMESGDFSEYLIDPTCEGVFAIE
jgi:hypothetical protein